MLPTYSIWCCNIEYYHMDIKLNLQCIHLFNHLETNFWWRGSYVFSLFSCRMLAPVVFPHIVNYEPKLVDYNHSEAIDNNIAQMNMIYNSSSESIDELCHPDWIEPAMQAYSLDISNYKERQNALDALQLFNANATLQVCAWLLLHVIFSHHVFHYVTNCQKSLYFLVIDIIIL